MAPGRRPRADRLFVDMTCSANWRIPHLRHGRQRRWFGVPTPPGRRSPTGRMPHPGFHRARPDFLRHAVCSSSLAMAARRRRRAFLLTYSGCINTCSVFYACPRSLHLFYLPHPRAPFPSAAGVPGRLAATIPSWCCLFASASMSTDWICSPLPWPVAPERADVWFELPAAPRHVCMYC